MGDFLDDWYALRRLIVDQDVQAVKSFPHTLNLDMCVNDLPPLIFNALGHSDRHREMVSYLLEKGARPDRAFSAGNSTPIECCVKYGYISCLKELLKAYGERYEYNWRHMRKPPYHLVEGYGKSEKDQETIRKVLRRYDPEILQQQEELQKLSGSIKAKRPPRILRRPKR
jgi:ankyrin repeat protein